MTIEEEINSQKWWVLQQIKKKSVLLSRDLFYLKKATPFEIGERYIGLVPAYATQIEILDSLDRDGVIKVYKGYRAGDLVTSSIDDECPEIEVRILKPKFDKVYKKFQNACDIGSYLNNTFQTKVYKNLNNGKNLFGEQKNIPEFLEVKSGKSNISSQAPYQNQNAENVLYSIQYTERREIVINNKYILCQPRFGQDNDLVFRFLYQKPTKSFTHKEVESEIKEKLDGVFSKRFNTILSELGFTGQLRRLFFPNVSRVAIKFNNNLTKTDLEKLKIDEKKLKAQLKKLKRYQTQ